jgi:hypothetical protein
VAFVRLVGYDEGQQVVSRPNCREPGRLGTVEHGDLFAVAMTFIVAVGATKLATERLRSFSVEGEAS